MLLQVWLPSNLVRSGRAAAVVVVGCVGWRCTRICHPQKLQKYEHDISKLMAAKCPWLMSYWMMKLIIGHRDQSASGWGQWWTTLRRNVVPQWLGPCAVWPIECCYHRLIQQTWRFEIIFLFSLRQDYMLIFPCICRSRIVCITLLHWWFHG